MRYEALIEKSCLFEAGSETIEKSWWIVEDASYDDLTLKLWICRHPQSAHHLVWLLQLSPVVKQYEKQLLTFDFEF